MAEFFDVGIFPGHFVSLLGDGIIPSYLRRVGIVASLHLRKQQGSIRAEEIVAIPEIVVEQRVFPGRPFPGCQGRRTIGQEDRSQGSVLKSQGDAGRILHREVPDLVAHQGIDFIDLAADIPEVIDLMDQIDQDRPSALSPFSRTGDPHNRTPVSAGPT